MDSFLNPSSAHDLFILCLYFDAALMHNLTLVMMPWLPVLIVSEIMTTGAVATRSNYDLDYLKFSDDTMT